jgi:GNAT superfamily N-acetyltransferase
MNSFLSELDRISRRLNDATFAFLNADGSDRGFVQFTPTRESGLCLHRLWVLKPGQGHGSMILRTLCDVADLHGVEIFLKCTPFGAKPYPFSREQLADWYRRHGFEGSRWKLARKPRLRAKIVQRPSN